jgi:signal transduction histidine kinase
MFIAAVLFYYTTRSIVYRQIDESLITEKSIIQDQIEETDTIPDFSATFGHLIEVKILNSRTIISQVIRDTDIYDASSDSNLPFRHIRYSGNTHGQTGYTINIYQLLDEKQDLLSSIGWGMFFLFLSLFMVSLIVNYLVSKKILSPFFNAVNEAAKFNILSQEPLHLPETNINEFKQLNKVIENMTKKMRTDYINLKEYNENSSHEIQTPLAIIRSKLDILMQNKSLNKVSLNLIKSINEATTKLYKLNQGLLLISKIENLQFPEIKELSLRGMIERCFENYEEIMNLKNIKTDFDMSDDGIVLMNEILADIMISNILSNAVRYNIDNGFILCRLDSHSLTITNSGIPLDVDPEELFNRFRKGTANNQQSVGLGLSIIRKITETYKMHISYTCRGSIHEMKLDYVDLDS